MAGLTIAKIKERSSNGKVRQSLRRQRRHSNSQAKTSYGNPFLMPVTPRFSKPYPPTHRRRISWHIGQHTGSSVDDPNISHQTKPPHHQPCTFLQSPALRHRVTMYLVSTCSRERSTIKSTQGMMTARRRDRLNKSIINIRKSITRIMHYSTYHTLPEKTIQSINQPTNPKCKERSITSSNATQCSRLPSYKTQKRKQCDFEVSPKYHRGKDQRRRCDFSVQVYKTFPQAFRTCFSLVQPKNIGISCQIIT